VMSVQGIEESIPLPTLVVPDAATSALRECPQSPISGCRLRLRYHFGAVSQVGTATCYSLDSI
jgi:hypothetical protein